MSITQADVENYGPEFLDVARRAALDALAPEVRALQQQNAQLRQMAQRSQRAEIERTLDRDVPNWHEIYNNPAFSVWLEAPDSYSPTSRSQLLRRAVADGDSGRVVSIYKGFEREGHHASAYQSRAPQSRQTASGGAIYSRQDIARLYERRRKGEINDAQWRQIEPDIVRAASQGRVAGALNLSDGTAMSRLG
jgi:hypothetical protein